MISKDEGKVKDLVEKLERGEITKKEAIRELYRRGLQHGRYGHFWLMSLSMVAWGVLCFVSGIAKATNIPILELFVQLPAISFLPIIAYLALVLVFSSFAVALYATYFRAVMGGCGWKGESETVTFVRRGPYKIMRHPAVLGFCGIFVFLTVFLSEHVPFNILSVIGNLLLCLTSYYSCMDEEKLGILKWGDTYRQYMKEVPRFNFIKGLWNLRRRGG